MSTSSVNGMKMNFGHRRAVYVDVADCLSDPSLKASSELTSSLTDCDLIYRSLCGILYNFVPQSGHPGGSISSGRIVESLLYNIMHYNMSDPDQLTADIISYAAGHKAMGLYAMWALRNEILKQHDEGVLPKDIRKQLRLEDLLGFRRNPTQHTVLFQEYGAKSLDGHPCPIVPFIKLSTGASGVGVPSSFGLAFGARDYFGKDAPTVHVIEGEGGITAGRTQEAMASAATAQLNNIIMHLDWNQASIDSNRVCREGNKPGDYVQWDPTEFAYFHDWNVIYVQDGFNFDQIIAAQTLANQRINNQPTCIVYKTVKGWQYGIEGRKSHGAGHKICSDEFYTFMKPFEDRFSVEFPRPAQKLDDHYTEQLYFEFLTTVRNTLNQHTEIVNTLGKQLTTSAQKLAADNRVPRKDAPNVDVLYSFKSEETPKDLVVEVGSQNTLRGALGDVLNHLNVASKGAILACAADLYGSTSTSNVNKGFSEGFWNAVENTGSRLLSIGGICEDAMGATMTGISSFGTSIGVASSYGAFIAALEHIAGRLHGIGQQAKKDYNDSEYNPFFLVCAHAGLKTGEDGPTHADPQPLQLMQENFPKGVLTTLTPWDPNEMWPVVIEAMNQRPAVIVPFVTRPNEKIFDRVKLGLPPVSAAAKGVYAVRKADKTSGDYHGTLVIQGSGVMNTFVEEVLPQIDKAGLNMNIFYVTSTELYNMLPESERDEIFPHELSMDSMGITGFTLPTMYRWVNSDEGRKRTLHAFRENRFMGSGQAHKVLEEARLHGDGQWHAVKEYAEWFAKNR